MTTLSPTLHAFLTEAVELGIFPASAQAIQEVAEDPLSSDADLARVIALDPFASARMLKLANSALYCRGRSISDVREAITRLGFRTARDLAIAISLGQQIQKLCPTGQRIWTQSVRTGIALDNLGRYVRAVPRGTGLTIGLLHDIGLTAMVAVRPNFGKVVKLLDHEGKRKLHTAERMQFGADHAVAGAALLRAWGIPPLIFNAVERQYVKGEPVAAAITLAQKIADPTRGKGKDLPTCLQAKILRLRPIQVVTTIERYDQQSREVGQILIG